MVANPARGNQTRENIFFPVPGSRLKWSRETGSAVPSRVSTLNVPTHAESDAYSRIPLVPPAFRDILYTRYTIVYIYKITPSISTVNHDQISPEFMGSRTCVTDGVHRQEFAGTVIVGPFVLMIVLL